MEREEIYERINKALWFISAFFEPGKAKEQIESIADDEERSIAYAQYYYFTSNYKKSMEEAQRCLLSTRREIGLIAVVLIILSSLSAGELDTAKQYIDKLFNSRELLDKRFEREYKLIKEAGRILFNMYIDEDSVDLDYAKKMPLDIQIFVCFLMAQDAFQKGKYERSLGIIEATLTVASIKSPIILMYMYLVAAADKINLKESDDAKKYFMKVWDIAKAEEIYEPIGQYHGLLQGLVECCIREEYPNIYRKIINITFAFGHAWMGIHAPDKTTEAADLLTGIEFSISMLVAKGWSNREIADYLGITVRTVKYHLTSVFKKFNIKSRKEIKAYLP